MPPAWFEKWVWRSGMRNTVLQGTERGASSCHMDVSIVNARFVHHAYQRFEIRWSRQFPAADTHEIMACAITSIGPSQDGRVNPRQHASVDPGQGFCLAGATDPPEPGLTESVPADGAIIGAACVHRRPVRARIRHPAPRMTPMPERGR